MKGHNRVEVSPNRSNTFYNFYLQILTFPTPLLSFLVSTTIKDVLSDLSDDRRSSLRLCVHQSDRCGQELDDINISTAVRSSARVC
jgi:hypothetical protein